jgi:flagellar hook-associated protein 3 FlgL
MRVTMNTRYEQINMDLDRLVNRMSKTNSTISSGKIYRLPSDDPMALTHALGLRSSISDSEQYQRNMNYAQGWTTATETALSQMQDRLLRARTLAVQAANDSQNALSRQAIAAEVKTILEEVTALGNTKLGERYVLAGTQTRGYGPGEAPFVLEEDGSVTYNGNTGGISVDTASGLKQKINLDGHTALVQSGIFETLDLLYDGLMANSRADVEVALGDIDNAMGHLQGQMSAIGAQSNTLDAKQENADALILANREHLSAIEDTDIIQAATDLTTQETNYQAALAAAARIMNLSLVDYIR